MDRVKNFCDTVASLIFSAIFRMNEIHESWYSMIIIHMYHSKSFRTDQKLYISYKQSRIHFYHLYLPLFYFKLFKVDERG